ncbi:MAG: acyl-ACP--UDP-N-acetylglucosamine O-acyltransferase [Alphaproteobacteria bacterium]|nr:acyl-ACP--UDP-N-acetylglucosamine O-acyltransferase [Alphaproteobacteria bacterium]
MSIHSTAIVDPSAEIHPDAEIGPWCMIGPGVRVGARARLSANAHIQAWTDLAEDVQVHPYAVVGAPPQDLSYKGEETRLVVGPRTVIREHATLHRGTLRGKSVTRVGADCFIMSQAHVAHDCTVGNNVVLAQAATLGGHVKLEDFVFLGGLCAIHQFGRVGRYAFVGGLAAVVADVIPFGSAFGNHAHLAGLNIVGMKRRNLSRETIHDLRAAYRLLFAEEGTFQERLEDVAQTYAGTEEVMEIVDFIRADANRPLCMPHD